MRAAALGALRLPLNPFFDDALRRSDPLAAPNLSTQAILIYMGGPNVQQLAEPPTSTDRLDHNYGLYFFWITCPALGREVLQLLDIVRPQLLAHGFPPLITLRFVTGRSIVLIGRLVFDRKQAERCTVARTCYHAILDATIAAGYPPARMGIDGIEHLDPDGSAYWQIVGRLKQALDPQQILAPGRYVPMSTGNSQGRMEQPRER